MASPNFTYSPNVPQANQKISATQNAILSNFQSIPDFLSVNHYGFTDSSNYGKHSYTSLVVQSTDQTTDVSEMAVYAKSTPSGPNAAEIFARYPSNGAVIQLTGGLGGGISATSGWAYMSSSVFMIWGTATGIVSSASNTINFPSGGGFPSFSSTPYQVYYSAAETYTNIQASTYISSTSSTNFVLTVPNANYATSIYWMAIGA